ncbi:MAG TPA: EAL domain-containing protein [Solirubrobacteraceae bacterium]|nr:EAL domain-containing protein [Solirubrobacteraceae bacterium]
MSAARRAAQQLHEARDHLRAVTDSMGEALCTLDHQGHVSYMNAAAERLLGWSTEAMRGHTLHDVTHFRHPDGSPYPIDDCPLYAGHTAREAVRVEDDMFVRRDGTDLAVSWVLTPFDSSTGNNSVIVFTDNTQAKAAQEKLQHEIEQLTNVRDLHEALQERRFELFAQPIVDLSTGDIVAHELLLRMRERDGGIRTPGSFLPIAERCGLIRELDRWVIGQSARLAGEGHRVELNLSARSIGDPDLFDFFAKAIARHDADPSLMVIELTETALMRDETAAQSFVERVRVLGCEFALDDFGTGFGGLSYLKRLPVDYLKIDIEFVRDLCTNSASRHVVEAVVGLAKAFGHQTVAEGVENDETLAMVRSMGVDYAQGFGLGWPAPLNEMLDTTGHSIADERDQAGDQRDHAGDQRDHAGDQRDHAGDQRDHAAEQRDHAGTQRDLVGVRRDHAAEQRDHAGTQRDLVGVRRDQAGTERDLAGTQRDEAADRRDEEAEQSEVSGRAAGATDALRQSALARRAAASDRRRASQDRRAGAKERCEAQRDRGTALADRRAGARERCEAELDRDTALADRRAGAGERTSAELDRGTALADRGAGASERTEAELDRDTALADRGASARERAHSSIDELTGAYLRGAGLVELEREIARSKRSGQSLVLAFVDVDGLKARNDADGHAAGDRMLLEVATTFRAKLRSHDLIIRYGGDEFLCAVAGLSLTDATKRFARVNAALADAPERGSVTVGVAELLADDSLADLVARADSALYRARGRPRPTRDR